MILFQVPEQLQLAFINRVFYAKTSEKMDETCISVLKSKDPPNRRADTRFPLQRCKNILFFRCYSIQENFRTLVILCLVNGSQFTIPKNRTVRSNILGLWRTDMQRVSANHLVKREEFNKHGCEIVNGAYMKRGRRDRYHECTSDKDCDCIGD